METFLTQIKHTNGVWEKGCVVKPNENGAKQSMHAYLGAYAYGGDKNTDYVACYVMDLYGHVLAWEVYNAMPVPNEVI